MTVVCAGTLFQGSQAAYKFPNASNTAMKFANNKVWGLTENSQTQSGWDDATAEQWRDKLLVEGTAIFHAVQAFLEGKPKPGNIIVLAAYGGNGGGGIKAAELLKNEHGSVKVYYFKDYYFDDGETKGYSTVCKELWGKVRIREEFKENTNVDVKDGDLVLDGISGTGYRKPDEGKGKTVPQKALEALQKIGKDAKALVVALDILSGMDKDGKFPEITGFAPAAIIHIGFPKYYLQAAAYGLINTDKTEHFLAFYKYEELLALLNPDPRQISVTPIESAADQIEQTPPAWNIFFQEWSAAAAGGATFVHIK